MKKAHSYSCWIVFGLLGWLALMPAGLWGGPKTGPRSEFFDVEANGVQVFDEKFIGGQRACFIAMALGKQAPPITLTVYDTQNRVVGTDKGERTAVIWYPARDGEYKIEIRNSAAKQIGCYMAVK